MAKKISSAEFDKLLGGEKKKVESQPLKNLQTPISSEPKQQTPQASSLPSVVQPLQSNGLISQSEYEKLLLKKDKTNYEIKQVNDYSLDYVKKNGRIEGMPIGEYANMQAKLEQKQRVRKEIKEDKVGFTQLFREDTPAKEIISELADRVPKSSVEYITKMGYNESTMGLGTLLTSKEYAFSPKALEQYPATWVEDMVATTLGYAIDMPLMGGIGSVAAKGTTKLAMAGTKGTIEKLVANGVSEKAAIEFVKKSAGRKAALYVADTGASGITFGAYDATKDVLKNTSALTLEANGNEMTSEQTEMLNTMKDYYSDLSKGKIDIKDIDFLDKVQYVGKHALVKGGEGFVLGAASKVVGNQFDLLAKQGKQMVGDLPRFATVIGAKIAGTAAEAGVFTIGGSLMEGQGITKQTFGENVGLIMMMKALHLKSEIKGVKENLKPETPETIEMPTVEGFKVSNSENKEFFKNEIPYTDVDIEAINNSKVKSGKDIQELTYDEVVSIVKDEAIPSTTKTKVIFDKYGIKAEMNMRPENITMKGNEILFTGKDGVLIDKEVHTDSKAAAQSYSKWLRRQSDNVKEYNLSAAIKDDPYLGVMIDEELKANYKPINEERADVLQDLSEALKVDVIARTPEQSKLVNNMYSIADRITRDKAQEAQKKEAETAKQGTEEKKETYTTTPTFENKTDEVVKTTTSEPIVEQSKPIEVKETAITEKATEVTESKDTTVETKPIEPQAKEVTVEPQVEVKPTEQATSKVKVDTTNDALKKIDNEIAKAESDLTNIVNEMAKNQQGVLEGKESSVMNAENLMVLGKQLEVKIEALKKNREAEVIKINQEKQSVKSEPRTLDELKSEYKIIEENHKAKIAEIEKQYKGKDEAELERLSYEAEQQYIKQKKDLQLVTEKMEATNTDTEVAALKRKHKAEIAFREAILNAKMEEAKLKAEEQKEKIKQQKEKLNDKIDELKLKSYYNKDKYNDKIDKLKIKSLYEKDKFKAIKEAKTKLLNDLHNWTKEIIKEYPEFKDANAAKVAKIISRTKNANTVKSLENSINQLLNIGFNTSYKKAESNQKVLMKSALLGENRKLAIDLGTIDMSIMPEKFIKDFNNAIEGKNIDIVKLNELKETYKEEIEKLVDESFVVKDIDLETVVEKAEGIQKNIEYALENGVSRDEIKSMLRDFNSVVRSVRHLKTQGKLSEEHKLSKVYEGVLEGDMAKYGEEVTNLDMLENFGSMSPKLKEQLKAIEKEVVNAEMDLAKGFARDLGNNPNIVNIQSEYAKQSISKLQKNIITSNNSSLSINDSYTVNKALDLLSKGIYNHDVYKAEQVMERQKIYESNKKLLDVVEGKYKKGKVGYLTIKGKTIKDIVGKFSNRDMYFVDNLLGDINMRNWSRSGVGDVNGAIMEGKNIGNDVSHKVNKVFQKMRGIVGQKDLGKGIANTSFDISNNLVGLVGSHLNYYKNMVVKAQKNFITKNGDYYEVKKLEGKELFTNVTEAKQFIADNLDLIMPKKELSHYEAIREKNGFRAAELAENNRDNTLKLKAIDEAYEILTGNKEPLVIKSIEQAREILGKFNNHELELFDSMNEYFNNTRSIVEIEAIRNNKPFNKQEFYWPAKLKELRTENYKDVDFMFDFQGEGGMTKSMSYKDRVSFDHMVSFNAEDIFMKEHNTNFGAYYVSPVFKANMESIKHLGKDLREKFLKAEGLDKQKYDDLIIFNKAIAEFTMQATRAEYTNKVLFGGGIGRLIDKITVASKNAALLKAYKPISEYVANIINVKGFDASWYKHDDRFSNLVNESGLNSIAASKTPNMARQNIEGSNPNQTKLDELGSRYIIGLSDRLVGSKFLEQRFYENYEKITGNKFDFDRYGNDVNYRYDNYKNIDDAFKMADADYANIFAPQTKFGTKKTIRLGFTKFDQSSRAYKILMTMGKFQSTQAQYFWNNFRDMAYLGSTDNSRLQAAKKISATITSNTAYSALQVTFAKAVMAGMASLNSDDANYDNYISEAFKVYTDINELERVVLGNTVALAIGTGGTGNKIVGTLAGVLLYNYMKDEEGLTDERKTIAKIVEELSPGTKIQNFGYGSMSAHAKIIAKLTMPFHAAALYKYGDKIYNASQVSSEEGTDAIVSVANALHSTFMLMTSLPISGNIEQVFNYQSNRDFWVEPEVKMAINTDKSLSKLEKELKEENPNIQLKEIKKIRKQYKLLKKYGYDNNVAALQWGTSSDKEDYMFEVYKSKGEEGYKQFLKKYYYSVGDDMYGYLIKQKNVENVKIMINEYEKK